MKEQTDVLIAAIILMVFMGLYVRILYNSKDDE